MAVARATSSSAARRAARAPAISHAQSQKPPQVLHIVRQGLDRCDHAEE